VDSSVDVSSVVVLPMQLWQIAPLKSCFKLGKILILKFKLTARKFDVKYSLNP